MNRGTMGLRGLLQLILILFYAAICPLLSHAEIVEVGTHEITRYSVAQDAQAVGEPLAFGEIATEQEGDVSLEVVSSQHELSLSRSEATAVHQLLGHMLAMSAAPDTPDSPVPQHSSVPINHPKTSPTTMPTADVPSATSQSAGSKPFLGINLSDVTYYSRAWVFTDLMFQSDAWRKDGRGYVFKSGYAPTGQYICTWSGTGSIRFSGDASAMNAKTSGARVTIATGERGVNMQKVGEVWGASLMRVEHETRISPFQPAMLSTLKPFRVIRFMDWGKTNNSRQVGWRGRPRKGTGTQAGSDGVALEYMIALSNELGADPWFCMPHKADDDYIRRYAEMVRDRLNPHAKVYIEYSNEVWNSQFGQHDYIRKLGDGETYSDAFFDAWAERCRRTFEIWTEVFGDDATTRLVRVAAVHLQNPWVAKKLLPRLEGQFDAVAPSAYFGVTRKQAKKLTAASTVEEILDLCEQNIRDDNQDWYGRHKQLASEWSGKFDRPIRLISYEAGQHLSANGDENVPYYDALIGAQSHPRMYGVYLMNMRLFEQAGGDLFVAFNDVSKPGKFGSWGHLEYQTQPVQDAPKFKALLEYPSITGP
jgi:hypothetical protein